VNPPLVLVCSVGGSPDPIVTAIGARRPTHVLFVVSETTPAQPGSVEQIDAIRQRIADIGATDELVVPPDDPDRIFVRLRDWLHKLDRDPRFQGRRLIFDYTGGTKSMTAALFQAAVASAGAELQFMLGRRDNLRQVTPGTERPVPISIDWIVAERTEAMLRSAWKSYAYAECADGVDTLLENLGTDGSAPAGVIQRLKDLRDAARAFDCWDRFLHAEAAEQLNALGSRYPDLAAYAKQAAAISRCDGLKLLDLWHNAERCAERGRYDDAVARCYRLIEWTGQWYLRQEHGIDVNNMPSDHKLLTPERRTKHHLDKTKKTLSGLMQTLKLAADLSEDSPFKRFLNSPVPYKHNRNGEHELKNILELRNKSILAHQDRPLTATDWNKVKTFMDHFFQSLLKPLLERLLKAAECRQEPQQLPHVPPAGL
jgi:hypothetical protein